jgi:hypothetical protein
MKKVTIELSDELAAQMRGYEGRLPELVLLGLAQLKAQDALALYTRGLIPSSDRRTPVRPDLPRAEMIRHARSLGIRPRWDEQMVDDELA